MHDQIQLPEQMKIREITNSPAEEYARRPGAVRPLPDDVAAVLLHRTAILMPTPAGVVVKLDGRKHFFWRHNSIVCNSLGGEVKKYAVAYDPRDMAKVHVLTLAGAYVETLPAKALAGALQHDEASKKAYSDARTAQNRAAARLKKLHCEDSSDAVDKALRNLGEMQRVVTTLEAAGVPDEPEAAPAGTSRGYPSARKASAEAGRIDLILSRAQAEHDDAETLFDNPPSRGMVPAGMAPRRVRVPQPVAAADPDDDFDPFA